jgi:arylsulfatase
LSLGFVTLLPSVSLAQARTPNIVVIMGDDVGMWNLSAYHRGMMGGSTPNIQIPSAPLRDALGRLGQ